MPEPFRGKSFVLVEMTFVGGEADGNALVAPLRELGPAMDTFAAVPPTALPHLHHPPRGKRELGLPPRRRIGALVQKRAHPNPRRDRRIAVAAFAARRGVSAELL